MIVDQGSRLHSTGDQDDVATGGAIHILSGHDRRSLIAANQTKVDHAEGHLVTGQTIDPQFNRVKDIEKFSSSQAVNSHISRIIDHRKSTHACTLIFPLPQACPTNYNINISLSNPCIIAFIPTMNDSPVLCNFMSLCSSGFTDGLNSSKPP